MAQAIIRRELQGFAGIWIKIRGKRADSLGIRVNSCNKQRVTPVQTHRYAEWEVRQGKKADCATAANGSKRLASYIECEYLSCEFESRLWLRVQV